jgi:hypothetical protein
VLDLYGLGELQERLGRLVARRELHALGDLVGHELLGEVAIQAESWDEAAAAIRERYDGLLARVSLYTPPNLPRDERELARLVERLRG